MKRLAPLLLAFLASCSSVRTGPITPDSVNRVLPLVDYVRHDEPYTCTERACMGFTREGPKVWGKRLGIAADEWTLEGSAWMYVGRGARLWSVGDNVTGWVVNGQFNLR